MTEEAVTTEENKIEIPQNPYQHLTESDLNECIQKYCDEVSILEKQVGKKRHQKSKVRDQKYIDELCNLRDGYYNVQEGLRQIKRVVNKRIANAIEPDTKILREWHKLRKDCLEISSDADGALLPVCALIKDYKFDFPNEQTTKLKKLALAGAISAYATSIAALIFGDSDKAKVLTAAGTAAGLVLLNRLDKKDGPESKKSDIEPVRRKELKPYEIRQIYCFLS